jgi:hypothetical protein
MLTAVKAHKYGTRHLTAGENYEVPVRHAFALVAGKKARFAAPHPPAKPSSPPPVRELANPEPVAGSAALSSIEELRMQAQRLGIEVDGRWGSVRLQYEIQRAKG